MEKLCEGNTKNVMGIIENVSFTEQYFDLVIDKMLNIIYTKGPDLKIEHIFRKFCNLLNVEKTYRSICQQVLVYKDPRFVDQIVHVLGYILVTYEVLYTSCRIHQSSGRNCGTYNNQRTKTSSKPYSRLSATTQSAWSVCASYQNSTRSPIESS